MFGRVHLQSHLDLNFWLSGVFFFFNYQFNIITVSLVYAYFLFFPSSILRESTLPGICPFFIGNLFHWLTCMGFLVDVAGPQSSWQPGPAWPCDLECVRFCVCSVRKKSLFPTALWFFWKSHWPATTFSVGSFSQCITSGLGRPMQGSETSLLGENVCNYNYPLICGSSTRGMGIDCTGSPPFLPTLLWFLLYIFNCMRSLLLTFRSFSSLAPL